MSLSGLFKKLTYRRQLRKQIDAYRDTIAKLQWENKELSNRIRQYERQIQELLSTNQKLEKQDDKLREKLIALARDTGHLTVEEIQKIDQG